MNCRILLKITPETERVLSVLTQSYQQEVNRIIELYIANGKICDTPYVSFSSYIPYWSKSLIVNEAKRIFNFCQKYQNDKIRYHRVQCCWKRPNFRVLEDNYLDFQLGRKFGLGDHFSIEYIADKRNAQYLHEKLINMAIYQYKKWWAANITVEVTESVKSNSLKRMGVDLGMKVPAVAFTEDGKIRFFGNGRKSRYKQISFYTHLKIYQKEHDSLKIMQQNHSLYRWYIAQCHLISKQLIDFAIEQDVGVICVEELHGISSKNVTNSEKRRNLSQWCYYRLIQFLSYKAKRVGIQIIFVDPQNTSKRCPHCKALNNPLKRVYICEYCGYHAHRDLIGAMNITYAPESSKHWIA